MLFVCTAHIHWDPEYCDVKIVQTLMLLSELKTIMDDAIDAYRSNSSRSIDCASIPLVLCGDFNSLPDSGVIELIREGKISINHVDFKDLCYESYLQKYSRTDKNGSTSNSIVHHFKLESAYETTSSSPIMPYTNYTFVHFYLSIVMTFCLVLDRIFVELLIMSFTLNNRCVF